MSVKVAVRVRPFNAREAGSKCCVRMSGPQTVLVDPATEQERPFTFDYSFWSHDGFKIDDNGIAVKTGNNYADQDHVYDALGKQVLDNAWEGYNCCLFAYGQTGAGKSYSMIGYGANIGIVPIACNEIFQRIRKLRSDTHKFEVNFSMVEIYNEKVQDLLIDISQRPTGGLKVREHKTLGVYVQDLSKHPVDSYEAIDEKMEQGQQNRTIGSTQMNATSSRAHTLITIEFKQLIVEGGRPQEKFSVINLVDLAGSEKAGATGAQGDRLKEGAAINLSLTMLGQCISILAEKSSGKKKDIIVPFRNSSLTRILQNALGGNSKTIMICAISPAFINYEETLSTLRYADNAKKIQNKAVINESVQDKIIRELKEENAKLKDMLLKLSKAGGGGGPVDLKELGLTNLGEVIENMTENEKIMDDMQKPWEEKLAEAKAKSGKADAGDGEEQKFDDLVTEKQKAAEEKDDEEETAEDEHKASRRLSMKKRRITNTFSEDRTVPHLTNLHEDPQLSGCVFYSLAKGEIHIGRITGEPMPEILLGAVGIKPNHAKIKLLDNGLFELSVCDADAATNTMVNGKNMPKKRVRLLNHLDRIAFAGGIIYVFYYPLLNLHTKKVMQQNAGDNEGLDEETKQQQAWSEIQDSGIGGFTSCACPNYEFIEADKKAIDWEMAFNEVEEGEKAKAEKMQKELALKLKQEAKKNQKLLEEQQKEFEKQRLEKDKQLQEEMARYAEERAAIELKIAEQERLGKSADEEKNNQIRLQAQQLADKEREIELAAQEMERKEASFQKRIEEQKALAEREEKREQQNREKKDIIMSIKQDIEPLIIEANEIANSMNYNVMFELQFAGSIKDESVVGDRTTVDELLKQRKEKAEIKVENHDNNQIYLWSPEKFKERLIMMKDMVAQYGESSLENPFTDEPEPLLIGEGYYSLESLAWFIDNAATVNLIGSTFEVHGKLDVNIIPLNPDGSEELEMIPDEPSDLIDQRIDFAVQINQAIDLPEDLCRDIYVEYSFYLDPTKYRTEVVKGNNRSPTIAYRKKHTVEIVTKMLVDYLEKDVMVFRVYGFADVKSKPKKDVKRPTKKPQNFLGDMSTNDSINMSNTSMGGKVPNSVSVQQRSQAIPSNPTAQIQDPSAAARQNAMQSQNITRQPIQSRAAMAAAGQPVQSKEMKQQLDKMTPTQRAAAEQQLKAMTPAQRVAAEQKAKDEGKCKVQ